MRNVDLHCHSNVSDGVLAPAAVAEYARKAGVDVWALTDHDEVGGIAAARAAAPELGMRFVPGVEISITWANQTVHIVGLRIDEHNPGRWRLAADPLRARRPRPRDRRSAGQGRHPDAYEGALKYVGNPDLMSRTHFARYLVETGACANTPRRVQQVSDRRQAGLCAASLGLAGEAVGWIRGAGGIAVIAHPGRYKFSAGRGRAVRRIQAAGRRRHRGGDRQPHAGPVSRIRAAGATLRLPGLARHRFPCAGRIARRFRVLPPLPASVTPVWHDWF